jgi:hypothetical protein
LFAGKLTLIQSRAEAAAAAAQAAKAAEAAEAKQKREARHHKPSPHLSDGSKQKKDRNPKTDEELESTRCRRYSERKRRLSQTPEAETKRPRSSAGRSTEKETLSTAKIVAESLPVPHLDASKYLPWKGSRTAPTSVVCTTAVPAIPATCPSAVHPSPVTCLTAVPLSHPPAVPLSHPTADPPSSVTVTTAVHPPSVTCTTAVRSTVRQIESRSPSKSTRSQLCPDSSKEADRLPFKSPAKKADPPSLQRKRPYSGGDNSAKENETPVVFDLRSKLRHGSGNRNDPTSRSNSVSAKSDLRQVSVLELTHTSLVHRVEKSVHLRLGRPSLACDDAEKDTRQKKSPEKCNVRKTFEVPCVPDVLTKDTIQNTLAENRTSHSRKDDQKSTSSFSASVLLPLPSAAPAEDLEEGEITDEDVESDVEQQLTTFSGSGGSSSVRELSTNGPEIQSQKLPDAKLASDSLVRKNEDVSKRSSRESLSELEPVIQASRKEPKLMMKEKSTDENIVKMKKSGKHLKEGKSREEEAAKGNTNRGRERIELELKLDVGGCGQQEPRVLLKRLDMKKLQQVERLQPAKEQTPPIEELSKESKKAEKEKREQEVQKRLLDKLEKQRMLQVQKMQLVKESGQEEKELQLEKLGTSREQVLQEEECRQESQERLFKKDKIRKQEVVAEKKDNKNQQKAQEMRLDKAGHKCMQELDKAPLKKSDEKCSQVDQGLLLEKQKMMSKVLEKDGEMCGRRQERKQSKPDEKSHQNKEKEEKDRRRSSSHQKPQREKEEGQDAEQNNSQKNQLLVHTEKGDVQIKKPENNVSQGIQNQLDKKKADDCLQESKDTERRKEEIRRIENRARKHSLDSFLSKENAADSRKGKLLSSEKAGKEAKSRRESVKSQDRDSKDVTPGAVTVLPRQASRPVRSMKDFCDQLVETLFPEQRDEKGRDASDGAARPAKLKEKHAVGAESVPSLDKEAIMADKADKSNPELNASCTGTPVDVEMVREISKDTREDLRGVKTAVKALEKDEKDAGRDKELAKAAKSKEKSSNNPEAERKAFKTAKKAVIVEKKTASAVTEEKVTSKSADMKERADKTAEKKKRVLLSKTAEESIRAKKATEVVMGDSKSEKTVALNMGIHRIGEKIELSQTATEDASKALPQDETVTQTVGLHTKVAKNMEEDRRPSKPAEVKKGAANGDRKVPGNAEVGSKTGMAVGNCKDATRTMGVENKVAKTADRELSADRTTHAKKLMPVRVRGVDDEGRKAPAEKQNLKTGDTTCDESEDPSIPEMIEERVEERIASASASVKRAFSRRGSGDLEQLKGRTYKYHISLRLNAQYLLRLRGTFCREMEIYFFVNLLIP